MTNALRLAGVNLPGVGYPQKKNFVVPDFPVKTGLVGLYVLGGTESLSKINHANTALPLTRIGAPVINAAGATLSYANCFDTGIQSSATMTFIAVAQLVKPAVAGERVLLISNYQNVAAVTTGDSIGYAQFPNPSVAAYGGKDGGVASSHVDSTTGVAGQWNASAGRVAADGASKSWWSKAGVLSTNTAVGGVRALAARNLRLGGHYQNNDFQGVVTMQMGAIFTAALTDAEVAQNLAYLTNTYGPAALGVATL